MTVESRVCTISPPSVCVATDVLSGRCSGWVWVRAVTVRGAAWVAAVWVRLGWCLGGCRYCSRRCLSTGFSRFDCSHSQSTEGSLVTSMSSSSWPAMSRGSSVLDHVGEGDLERLQGVDGLRTRLLRGLVRGRGGVLVVLVPGDEGSYNVTLSGDSGLMGDGRGEWLDMLLTGENRRTHRAVAACWEGWRLLCCLAGCPGEGCIL